MALAALYKPEQALFSDTWRRYAPFHLAELKPKACIARPHAESGMHKLYGGPNEIMAELIGRTL